MPNDHVLKKMNFNLLTPRVVWGWGGSAGIIFATMLHVDSLSFDMQHDHVLKKFNFTFDPTPSVHPGVEHRPSIKSQV